MSKKTETKQFYIPALLLVIGAGLASAAFNINGALITYVGWLGAAFALGIACIEGIALIAFHRSIVDFQNQHFMKAFCAFILFVLMTIGCALSGKRAFKAMNLDAQAQISNQLAKADRIAAEADRYFADALAATDMNQRDMANSRGEKKQAEADRIRAEQNKRTPITGTMEWIFLILFFQQWQQFPPH